MDSSKAEWVLSAKSGQYKEKIYESPDWAVLEARNLNGTYCFFHTNTYDLTGCQIEAKGGAKEFGMGFYTTASDDDTPWKIIGNRWFEPPEKQFRYDWHVIAFAIPGPILMKKLCGKQNMAFQNTIGFYLTHSTGYPSQQKIPNLTDLQGINEINRKTHVLIFPDNKETKVAYGPGSDEKSWIEFTAGKGGGLEQYSLIIGPQQPEYMHNYRQYAWVSGWGIFLINSGLRYFKFRNYKIKSNKRIADGKVWPKGLGEYDTLGNKIGKK